MRERERNVRRERKWANTGGGERVKETGERGGNEIKILRERERERERGGEW